MKKSKLLAEIMKEQVMVNAVFLIVLLALSLLRTFLNFFKAEKGVRDGVEGVFILVMVGAVIFAIGFFLLKVIFNMDRKKYRLIPISTGQLYLINFMGSFLVFIGSILAIGGLFLLSFGRVGGEDWWLLCWVFFVLLFVGVPSVAIQWSFGINLIVVIVSKFPISQVGRQIIRGIIFVVYISFVLPKITGSGNFHLVFEKEGLQVAPELTSPFLFVKLLINLALVPITIYLIDKYVETDVHLRKGS